MSFEKSILARFLRGLTQAVYKHPQWFVYPQLLLAGLGLWYAVQHLELDLDGEHLVSAHAHYQQVLAQFRQEFPGQDPHVVLVESGDWWRTRRFLQQLAGRLEPQTNLFTGLFYRVDPQAMGRRGLLLASTAQLEQMQQTVQHYAPVLRDFAQTTNLNGLFSLVNAQFRAGARQADFRPEALSDVVSFLDRLVVDAHRSVLAVAPPSAPSLGQLLGGDRRTESQGYLTLAEGRMALLLVRPRSQAVLGQGIESLRSAIQRTREEVPGVNVGLTGVQVLNYDELRQSRRDAILASAVALVLCSLLFIAAYREVGRPLKAALCLLIGLGYTLGFAAFAVGHLNLLSVSCAPMLIGLAIDRGVHLMSRYEEEMRHRRPMAEALYRAMVFTGQGVVAGGLAMGVAFLAMGLVPCRGIREVGIVGGGGLLLCLVPMLTTLPALLMQGRQNQRDAALGRAGEARLRMEKVWLQHPFLAVAVTAALCAGALFFVERVAFDYNLLRLQSPGLASVRAEHKLMQSAGRSVLFASVVADSPQQARLYEAKLRRLPSVAGVETLASYLGGDPGRKLELIRSLQSAVAGVRAAPPDANPPKLGDLSVTLWTLSGYLAWAADVAEAHNAALAEQIRALRGRLSEFRETLQNGGPDIARQLGHYQVALFTELHQGLEMLRRQDTSGPLRVEDLPPAVRSEFVGVSGKWLLQVYPRQDLWQRANQEGFLRELQQVLPPDKITGAPVQIYEGTALLKRSYERAACYALGAIVLLLWLHFRSVSLVALALLPVGLGLVWLLGWMGAWGLAWDPANLMALPLLLGIGVTYSLQMLNRFAEERHAALLARSTGKAVLVCGLTALAAFGTLLLAKDPGMRSVGHVMSAGIAACLFASLMIMPALLSLLLKHAKVRPLLHRHLHHGLGWIAKPPPVDLGEVERWRGHGVKRESVGAGER